jgi:hypothetical protein
LASVGRKEREVLGPDTVAGFFRKAALDRAGRCAPEVGPRLIGVDLALALQVLGYRCVLEPQCRVYAPDLASSRPRGFHQAREAEQLFWRWAPCAGWPHSLVAHGVAVLGETVLGVLRPDRVLAQLAGRMLGVCASGARTRHYRRLLDIGHQAISLSSTSAGPHFPVDAPADTTRPSRHELPIE